MSLRDTDEGSVDLLVDGARQAAAGWAEHFARSIWFPACGSPIEQRFLAALVIARPGAVRVVTKRRDLKKWVSVEPILGAMRDPASTLFEVRLQWRAFGWRNDFYITASTTSERARRRQVVAVVECDGHEFHERTKKQAARDRSRDRAAQEGGALIFRFTGSELHADPGRCARQVIWLLDDRIWRA